MDKTSYKKYEPFFGAWHITKLLGEGSFGKVFEIKRQDFGETYKAALKVITVPQSESEVKSVIASGMDDDGVSEYFENVAKDIVSEFVLMSKLKGNSHVVSYEDHLVVKHEDSFGWDIFIRMELLTPLFDYTKNTELTRKDIMKLGIDMCHALELCQKQNIIHRDIKPENIFVSESGHFKLGDFGIARTIEKTSSGLSKKGTYTYMAPEVYKGLEYGSSVDIYSLGLVLYRLLNNNRTPFLPPYPEKIKHSDLDNALVLRISGEPIPAPTGADGRLAEIVLKACAHNSKDRYSSPMQMRMELEAILYETDESKVIYPHGDKVDVMPNEYEVTDEDVAAEDAIEDEGTVSLFGDADYRTGAQQKEPTTTEEPTSEPQEKRPPSDAVPTPPATSTPEPERKKSKTSPVVLVALGGMAILVVVLIVALLSQQVGTESVYVGQLPETAPEPTVEPASDVENDSDKVPEYIYIQGVRYSTSLTELSLHNKNLRNSDIYPLRYMANLRHLHLNNNQISDLTSLSGLMSLGSLHLSNNQISDLSPLSGLTSLSTLHLNNNQISDLSPLSGLTSLSNLNLSGNQISDLSPLSGLTNLSFLNLSSNQISYLSPLSGLTNLSNLNLSGNQISDLSPLSGLRRLSVLSLHNNPISDWQPVAHVGRVWGRR